MNAKEFEKQFRSRLLKPLDEIHSRNITESEMTISQKPHNNDFMTLTKYTTNPTGKGTAYVANRSAIKNGLNMTYIKLLREHRKEFYAIPYIYGNGDILYYVKVPSEEYKINKISYDVLFLLKYDKNLKRANRHMFLYSNSPAFIFTYCYVYNKNGLLIDTFKSKLPIDALTKKPVVRNPIESFGFDKSTYIGARYLIDGGCLNDEYVNRHGKTMNQLVESDLIRKIADPELLVAIYQHAQYNERKKHRKELSANEKKNRDERNRQYAREQKKMRPKSGFLVHKSPRGKINARKAQRALINGNKKDSK